MDLRVKAWQLPPRLITGAYFLSAGLSKRGADDATAGQLHGFASGTYPVLGKLDAKRFTGLLSTAEIAIGTALVLPVVPAWLAGAGLTAFALRTLGMRQEGSLRPTQQGIPLAKDAWMVGIGLALKRFACSGDMLTTRGIRGGSACACCIGPWVLMLRRRLWAGWLPVCLPAVAAERHALGAVVADHVDG